MIETMKPNCQSHSIFSNTLELKSLDLYCATVLIFSFSLTYLGNLFTRRKFDNLHSTPE